MQIAGEEVTHLSILQSGLASSDLVQDCLAVAKVEIFSPKYSNISLIFSGPQPHPARSDQSAAERSDSEHNLR